jgi:hypothetical protein
MSTSLRHFTAIGLTTALVFGVFQYFYEWPITPPGHPTTTDMVLFILATFFGPLAVASLVVFPIVSTFSHLLGKRRVLAAFSLLALPTAVPVILCLLYLLVDALDTDVGYNQFFTSIGNVLFLAFGGSTFFGILFYFYCCIVWFGWLTTRLSRRHRPNTSLEPTPTAP